MTEGDGRAGESGPPLDRSALERLQEWGGPTLQGKMIELFVENGPERIREVRRGVEAGDLEAAERAAHSLKSSAGNLGAVRLNEAARRMEGLLEKRDGQAASELLPEMERHFQEALQALEEIRDES